MDEKREAVSTDSTKRLGGGRHGHLLDQTRYFWTFIGGLLACAGGTYLTIVYAPFWLNGITSGRG